MTNIKNQIFSKPITELVKERISIRAYEPKPLEDSIKKNLISYLENLNGPFNTSPRYKLIDSKNALNSDIKLGTYGMIRGASSYVAAAIKKEDMYLEELGYELEKFILYAASLGLGTCWLGGTFKKGEFAKAIELKDEESLPIVTPVGYPGSGRNLLASIVRTVAGSKNRKRWEELFFNSNFDKKLTSNEAGVYSEALESIRLAPSASNKQPWRIVKENDSFHFYLAHTKGYGKGLEFDVQKIDIGIAMCHFDLTLKEAGIEGSWQKLTANLPISYENTEYIISWIKM